MPSKFNFIVASGVFAADLPPSAGAVSEAGTSILAFGGARDLGYLPADRIQADAITSELEHEYDIEVDGRIISMYRRAIDPLTYSAVWRLNRGALCTFVDESAASAKAMEAVAHWIQILDADAEVPRLGLRPPLARASLRDMSYRDYVCFESASGDFERITFIEDPTRRTTSATAYTIDDRTAEAYGTSVHGVRVSVIGASNKIDDLRDIAADVVASVRPQ